MERPVPVPPIMGGRDQQQNSKVQNKKGGIALPHGLRMCQLQAGSTPAPSTRRSIALTLLTARKDGQAVSSYYLPDKDP